MIAVDLFSGWGGFTLGATMAGLDVALAANHWPLAVEAHAANHPDTEHRCQDLRQIDWTSLPAFDVLLASPACQPHSNASQPRRRLTTTSAAERTTPLAVVACADVCEPAIIVVENVPEFVRWRLFPGWCGMLRDLGYTLDTRILDASAHGVPQRRRRLFVVATRKAVRLEVPTTSAVPAFEPCVDWTDGDWRPIAWAKPGARARIEAGRRLGRRYWVQHVTGHRGLPLDRPLSTITCQDQHVVVDGDHYRPLTIRETARAMGFPDTYGWPGHTTRRDAIRGLGNAVCPPVARDLLACVADQIGGA